MDNISYQRSVLKTEQELNDLNELIDIKYICNHLNVCRQTASKYMHENRMKSFKIGRKFYTRKKDYLKWINYYRYIKNQDEK